jgi:hypothetical protein
MALVRGAALPTAEYDGSVRFEMTDRSVPVLCRVSRRALDDRAIADDAPVFASGALFFEYRWKIEAAADRLYCERRCSPVVIDRF